MQTQKINVFRCKSARRCEEQALVLEAVGIPHEISMENGTYSISVDPELTSAARKELMRYRRENRFHRAARPPPRIAVAKGLLDSLPFAALLLAVDLLRGFRVFDLDFWSAGRSHAELVVSGQWWRCITALTLHADLAHLAGNLVFGSLFFVLVRAELGSGLAWLLILAGGASGNALNAWLQPPHHTAVGASTAVFAALGIQCALAWLKKAQTEHRLLRRFGPLIAGIVLLSLLGTGGERTDVMAHAAGFCCGLTLGALSGLLASTLPRDARTQKRFGHLALAIVGASWVLALINA